MVQWNIIVISDTGGAKSNEKDDAAEEKNKIMQLSAIDVPVRMRIFSERALSAAD
jgi:hypothetical protein